MIEQPLLNAPGRWVGHALSLAVLGWAALVAWAALSGALATVPLPAFALLVAIGIAVPTALYFTVAPVRHWVARIGLRRLSRMHVWRIPAGLMFFAYGWAGALPPLFWVLAGVGDLIAGWMAWRLGRDATTDDYRRFHRFGFADFVVAVGTGLAFTLAGDARMGVLATLPMALIPLFGVSLSGASHIVAFDMLRRQRSRE